MNNVLEQINSVGKGFVDFAWPMLLQSSVLIAILLLVDFLLRRKVRAVFRYWLWMLVVIKLVLPTALSSPVSIGRFMDQPMAAINIAENRTPVAGDIQNVPNQSQGTEGMVESRLDSLPAATIHNPPVEPTVSLAWQGGVLLVWLAVVVAMLLLLLQRARFVCGLVRQAKEANDLMKDMLGFCCKTMGVAGRVGLKVSPNATSPAVCGLFKPVILLPHGLGSNLGSGPFRVVLMHELAHIKRADLWINLVQTVLQIAYFYNPLLWLANWTIRRVREQAVDEAVQVALGEKAQQYPETLLNVARLAFERPALSLRLIGVVESKSALAGRIKRMLTRPIPKTEKLGIIGLLAVILFAAVLLPMAKGMGDKPKESTSVGQIIKDESGKVTYCVNDKITLEILGITKCPVTKESVWWSVDGSALNKPALNARELKIINASTFGYVKDRQHFMVVYKAEVPKGVTAYFQAKSLSGPVAQVPFASRQLGKSQFVVAASDETLKAGDVVLTALVADDYWETVKKFYVGGDMGTAGDGMTYTTAGIGWGKTMITLNVTKVMSTEQTEGRVVAIDKKGRLFTQNGGGAVSVSAGVLYTQQLVYDLPKDSIDHLELQERPFKVYEFRNVSFEPGRNSNVTVKLASTDEVPSYVIHFETEAPRFAKGDSIEIKEIVGTAKNLQPGNRYIVRGRYKLGSKDKAMLHLYATNGETKCQQGPDVGRGEGEFERTFDYLKEGGLHLSFYPVGGGHSFGGVYFVSEKSEGVEDANSVRARISEQVKEQLKRDPITLDLDKKISEQESLLAKTRTSHSENDIEVLQLQELISSLKEEKQRRETQIIDQIRRAAEKKQMNWIDVAVEDFDIRQYPEGGLYTVKVSIRNKGTMESPKFGVYFYRGDPDETKPMTHEAGPIKPGEVWCEGSMPFALKEGINEIIVILDSTDQIKESDKMNNEASMKVVVKDGKIAEKNIFLPSGEKTNNNVEVKYQVNVVAIVGIERAVRDFPEEEDLSSPQTAYVAINRALAGGDFSELKRLSIRELAEKLAGENKVGKTEVEPEWARVLLNAKILEVLIYEKKVAAVFAELPQIYSFKPIQKPIDIRYLKLEEGLWLNTGNDRVWTIEEARRVFSNLCNQDNQAASKVNEVKLP